MTRREIEWFAHRAAITATGQRVATRRSVDFRFCAVVRSASQASCLVATVRVAAAKHLHFLLVDVGDSRV